jgi:GTP-binding protein
MHIEAQYIISKPGYEQAYDDRPSYILLGRSNVGKSSFINALLNRKQLARTSQTPGKTIALNYYDVNKTHYIIDAPGYGYARRSKDSKDYFYHMLNDVILHTEMLVDIYLLIDFKVGPTKDDLDVYQQLKSYQKPIVIIATKIDKIPVTKRAKQKKAIESILNASIHLVSNTEKIGFETLQEHMFT